MGHGFHIHDERHFLETYSLRQNWEVDLHPEEGCGGPVDLHLSLEIDPRTLLSFEDAVNSLDEDDAPPEGYEFPLTFTWVLPPLTNGPDLLRPGHRTRRRRRAGPAARGVGHRLLPVGHRRPPAEPHGRRPPGGVAVADPRRARRRSATPSSAAWRSAATCSPPPRAGCSLRRPCGPSSSTKAAASSSRTGPSPNRAPGQVLVRVARRRHQPGRPAPAGRPLPRPARRPSRHPRPRVRRRRRGRRIGRDLPLPRRPGHGDRGRRRPGRVPRHGGAHCARVPEALDLVEAGRDPRGLHHRP